MYKKRDKVRIKKIILDLHDVIADSKKVVVFENEIWKQSTEDKARQCPEFWGCLKMCEALSVTKCSRTRVKKCRGCFADITGITALQHASEARQG